ncbi:MAG: UDP-3-O-acyl-N-acetylglucosamine deacetylase, partial [Myxococcales bacterium]|nr:UDP-3-O-acyl-N-acetylglucosamine deacetylase [Myxococcales bacterium]
ANTVVFDDAGRCLNPGGLRGPDEPARHKLLDLLGDLALLGEWLQARVVAHRAGHALHHACVRAVRAATSSP